MIISSSQENSFYRSFRFRSRRQQCTQNLIYIQNSRSTTTNDTENHTLFVPSLIVSNVMSLAPKIDEISYVVSSRNPDIACFTETWLKNSVDNNVIDIPNYTIVRKDRSYAEHGGVCIYIKNSISFENLIQLEDPNGIEVLWCKLNPCRLPRGFSCLIVGVVYHPPSANTEYMINHLLETMEKIESYFPNAGIIITGDFNRLDISQLVSHYNLKQLVKFSTRGERILDLVLTNLKDYYKEP